MKNEAEEKRRADRFGCYVPVECKKGVAFDQSQTIDISKGGIGFITEERIPVNTKMAVEIALSPEEDPLLTWGQVKWVRPVPHSSHYRVGMKFEDISAVWQSRLNKYFRK